MDVVGLCVCVCVCVCACLCASDKAVKDPNRSRIDLNLASTRLFQRLGESCTNDDGSSRVDVTLMRCFPAPIRVVC